MELLLRLLLLLAAAHGVGALFARLRQPRVVGEIVGGALLGPTVLGRLIPLALPAGSWQVPAQEGIEAAGLLLLMFLSGASMRGLLGREDVRAVTWLATSGTLLPFAAAVAVAARVPLGSIAGPSGSQAALVLVLGIAAAVTSIPVISRIFHDLGLLETRFARLVLGVAVVEDVGLWAVLAAATAMAGAAELPLEEIGVHLLSTLAWVAAALLLARPLRMLESSPWNGVATRAPLLWLALALALYGGSAHLAGVKPVFAAFFAGLAVDGQVEPMKRTLARLQWLGFATLVPLYFACVGFELDFGDSFSPLAVGLLLAGASAIKLASVALGARLAGFRGLEVVNLAVATNARGGPGIVLASVAREAGIVSAAGYTALVILALVTSQAAGAWIEHVVRRGWPLLRGEPLPTRGG